MTRNRRRPGVERAISLCVGALYWLTSQMVDDAVVPWRRIAVVANAQWGVSGCTRLCPFSMRLSRRYEVTRREWGLAARLGREQLSARQTFERGRYRTSRMQLMRCIG